MTDSLAGAYKFAAGTLGLEMIVALGLLSDTLGIFAIFGMVIVGVAWLPAAWKIWTAARSEEHDGSMLAAYIVAIACGLVGAACLLTVVKWMAMTFAVVHT
jgi:hypothetical protein